MGPRKKKHTHTDFGLQFQDMCETSKADPEMT